MGLNCAPTSPPHPHRAQEALVAANPPASAGAIRDRGSTPWGREDPLEGNGHSLQLSCLGNPMDRGA